MSENRSRKIAMAVSMTLAGGLAASGAVSADNLFESESLDRGYRVAAADPESRCGEGSCGGEEGKEKEEEKEGESRCGEGSCGEEHEEEKEEEKEEESRCGEGSCGAA